jgi:PhnB protein
MIRRCQPIEFDAIYGTAGPYHDALADSEANKIILIELPVGPTVLRANDIPESMGRVSEDENRSKTAVVAESREEADRIFAGLSAGGAVEMPMGDSPWGTYFAMFRDKYVIEWTVEFSRGRQ